MPRPLILITACLLAQSAAFGQEAAPLQATPSVRVGPDGKPMPVRRPAEKPATAPDGKNAEEPKKGKESGDAKKPEDQPSVLKRPDKPPSPPNKDELNAQPNAEGLVSFSFRHQPWPDVLDWLAQVSEMSLDWQELPADYLNLTTQRPYTVADTRDLINRHLLLRGFTLLENGDLLSIAKIAAIDAGMVPRVTADQLAGFAQERPHAFVKVSFPLDWLLAEQAVEELKPMLSPNGKMSALKSTNRLEAMDAAINLRDILTVLRQEQSDVGQERLVKEFTLVHARASDVLTLLQELLGLESKKAAAPMNPQQMQQMQRQLQRQMEQAQRNGQQAPVKKEEPKVYLIVNQRRNSVLANAPPDKMAIIEQAVKALDVKTDRTDSLLARPHQMEVYRLHTLDPAALAKTLEELGELDPVTRLEVDDKNGSLIVYGSLVDHAMIRQLVKRLDGSSRRFEVIRLRRLAADYVAGTIEFMMVGDDKQQGPTDPYYYYRYGPGSREQKTEDKFRVDADIENNLLLLWASEPEIESVMNLLVKIGELPAAGGDTRKVRVLDAMPPEQAAELLDKLRRAWPSLAPNDLRLPMQQPKQEPQPKSTTEARVSPELPLSTFVQLTQEAAPPPVNLSIAPDGRIIITSDDTRALDLLEELIGQVSPPPADFRIFHLTFADAYWVKLNLEDFFKEEQEDTSSNSRYPYYYYYQQPQKEEPRYRLSKRRKLKFIYDLDTNSILVQGGDSQQMRTVEELINIYDRPQPADAKSARLSAVFPIRYSKASVIADAIKDVYRDLLSSNDKALASNPEKKEREPGGGVTYIYGGGGGEEEPERTQIRFKGKLSIGVDDVTNTLLVSCEGENLLQNVTQMVETLDKAAQPLSTVSTVQLSGNVNAAKVSEVLINLLLDRQQPTQEPQSNGQPANGQPANGQRQPNVSVRPRN